MTYSVLVSEMSRKVKLKEIFSSYPFYPQTEYLVKIAQYVRTIINNDNDNDMDDSENHVIGRLFCSTSRATVAA